MSFRGVSSSTQPIQISQSRSGSSSSGSSPYGSPDHLPEVAQSALTVIPQSPSNLSSSVSKKWTIFLKPPPGYSLEMQMSGGGIVSPASNRIDGEARSESPSLCQLPKDELRNNCKSLAKPETHLHLEGALLARQMLEVAAKAGLFVSLNPDCPTESRILSADEVKGKKDYILVEVLKNSHNKPECKRIWDDLLEKMTMMSGSRDTFKDARTFHAVFNLRGMIRDRCPLGFFIEQIINEYESQNVPYIELMYDKMPQRPFRELEDRYESGKSFDEKSLNIDQLEKYLEERTPFFESFIANERFQQLVNAYMDEIVAEVNQSEQYIKDKHSQQQTYTDINSSSCIRFVFEIMREKHPSYVAAKIYAALELMKRDKRFVGFTITGPEHDTAAVNNFPEMLAWTKFLCTRYEEEMQSWPNVSFHMGEMHRVFVSDEFLKNALEVVLHFAKPRRVSHGNSFDANQMEMLEQNEVMLEILPKSNEVMFGLRPKDHHISTALKKGCSVVIGSDDPGVYAKSLSEQWATMIREKKLSNAEIGRSIRMFIHRYAFLEGDSPYTMEGRHLVMAAPGAVQERSGAPFTIDDLSGEQDELTNLVARSERAVMALRFEGLLQGFGRPHGHTPTQNRSSVNLKHQSDGDE